MAKKQSIEHTSLLVLSLLSTEDMYGYQMIAELTKKFDNTFSMKEGTLYPVLKGLENDGFVDVYEEKTESGRTRKYYHLTNKGRRQLKTEAEAWRVYEKAINSVVERAVYGASV